MLALRTREYLLDSLAGTPDVLEGLLRGLAIDSPVWDAQPDPERFTLREVLAHLAESETLWKERVLRICNEEEPHFVSRPIGTDFGQSVPQDSLAQFRADRTAFVEMLRALPESAWERIGHSPMLGPLTVEAQAVFVLAHDGYHTQEIAEWVTRATNDAP